MCMHVHNYVILCTEWSGIIHLQVLLKFHTHYQKVIFKCEENDLFVAVDSTCKMQQTDMVKKFNWYKGQFFCNLLIVD